MIELCMCMRVCLRVCAIYVMCYMNDESSMVRTVSQSCYG